MSDAVYRPVGARAGWKLHGSRTCRALQAADRVEETNVSQHPHREWCQVCTGDRIETGGGSRELYEEIKQIGEQRTEATNDD